ncbi:hypothetical protein Pmani_000968 [Petrolisthes manimaculis]|uniref:Uncharacterized protein n=1 Tax=Petrolisthes manimaculis TaxID=1843537 RepID=A0AAE1QLG6_9EUCA|nr:hypothetical protein Pmani_000968 [Petrolisthes manimaculis]
MGASLEEGAPCFIQECAGTLSASKSACCPSQPSTKHPTRDRGSTPSAGPHPTPTPTPGPYWEVWTFFRGDDRPEVGRGEPTQGNGGTNHVTVRSHKGQQQQQQSGVATAKSDSPLAQRTRSTIETVMMGNIQGLYPKTHINKVPFLKELAEQEDPMIIALTETHLKSEMKEAEINIINYTPFRVDRETRSHGGVIIYVRNDLYK